jgi:hypothetical protein
MKNINLNKTDRLPSAFAYIESVKFDVMLGVASGFATIQEGLREDETIQHLLKVSTKDISTSEKIYSRIHDLSSAEINSVYAHPHDIPLVAYLWVLSKTNNEIAEEAAQQILTAENLFWAKMLARHILFGSELTIGA